MKDKEKYTFGYSDPRAMYDTAKAEDAAPHVKWDFLEKPHNDYEIAAALPWIGAAALVLLVLL